MLVQPMTRLRTESAKDYILDLCDGLLGRWSIGQHRFQFLVGDPAKLRRRTSLPVEIY